MKLQSSTTRNGHTVSCHHRRNCLPAILTLLLCAATIGDRQATYGQSAAKEESTAVAKDASNEAAPKKRTKKRLPENPFPDRPKVPAGILDGGKDWLNASGPISIKDLKGKIVLVDFWTYCCINCMHVLPDLKYLEKKYPKELVVIGVHSAKFDNEKDTENIRRAVQRYEIEHPVVNDADMTLWRSFGVRAWPTLVLLDPEGKYLGSISGEGNRELLETIIDKLIVYHKAKGTLDETPVQFNLESAKLKPTPLRFPSKVLADAEGGRLFIADTNHNRIVVTSLDGTLQQVIGSGLRGKKDGSFAEAQFDHPHGMELVGQKLYVADTENHMVRTVDLEKKTVTTLMGTGEQARRPGLNGRTSLRKTALNSPWALVAVDGRLYIAMAGPHQIWSHKLGGNRVSVFSGSGREDIVDGSHQEAALAQPSGIVTDGKSLYFVDSEGSSIRRADTKANGGVKTLIGPADLPSGRLFEFGDIDGVGSKARLQHPIGIAYNNKAIYVADSYNHKIKRLDHTAAGWKVTTLLGTGKRGDKLDPIQFSEPEGLSVAGGKLFIADTNNHRICVADLKTKKVTLLTIAGLKPPPRTEAKPTEVVDKKQAQKVPPQTVAAGETLDIEVELKLPEGFKLNKLFPVSYKLKAVGDQQLVAAGELNVRKRATADGTTVTVKLPLAAQTGAATLELSLSFGYCRNGVGGLCKIKTVRWQIPIKLAADAKQKTVKLEADATK
jgi:thiol-disulfide isomerase/thioredoxin